MSGIGGIAPKERDLSRNRDRQAAAVLALTAAITMLILFPLGLAIGLIAMAYAHVSGARGVFWAALVIVWPEHGLRLRPLPRVAPPG